ncbi:MAG TPA: hypothetical protein PKB03_07580 [Baekduia sp.]|nr:hypothetical protein [Baekduia sp.]
MEDGGAQELAKRIITACDRSKRRPADDVEQMAIEATPEAARRLQQLADRAARPLIPDAVLENIRVEFGAVADTINAYLATENYADQPWPVTWGQIQSLWNVLVPLLVIATPVGEASDEAADFRRRSGQLTRRLKDEVDEVRADLKRVRESLAQATTERDQALAATKDQVAAVQATITDQTTRLETAIRDQEAAFTTNEQRRDKTVETAVEDIETRISGKVDPLLGSVETRTQAAIDKAEADARATSVRIAELEEKATRSYNAIGNAGFAGAFQKDANIERRQVWIWQAIAVATFIALAAAGLHEINEQGSWSVGEGLTRLPVGLGLGSLAAFAITQVRRHRDAERASRQREIELTSIDPYLALIHDEQKVDELKVDHARRIFIESVGIAGQPTADAHGDD